MVISREHVASVTTSMLRMWLTAHGTQGCCLRVYPKNVHQPWLPALNDGARLLTPCLDADARWLAAWRVPGFRPWRELRESRMAPEELPGIMPTRTVCSVA